MRLFPIAHASDQRQQATPLAGLRLGRIEAPLTMLGHTRGTGNDAGRKRKKGYKPKHVTLFTLLLSLGAACRNRTGDLFITNELLYQLS
jgi:hypothetical protein